MERSSTSSARTSATCSTLMGGGQGATSIRGEEMMVRRVVVVGLGSIGRRYAANLRWLRPSVELIAWRHRPAGGAGDTEGIADRWVSSAEAAVAAGPDAAVVANPATMHLGAALPLAHAGVP